MGSSSTNFSDLIWTAWAPPKCKFFSWLAIQNQLWTADRLHSRGWPHNPVCSLCRRARETGNHLFFECRFTRHIWTELANWLAAPPLLPANWEPAESIHTWWTALARTMGVSRKGVKSIIILICWEIWKERNARIFDRLEAPSFMIIAKIKDEISTWSLGGAKQLASLVNRV